MCSRILTHLVYTTISLRWAALLPLFYRRQNWNIQGLSNLPKVTWLVTSRVWIQTQASWLPSVWVLSSYSCPPLKVIKLCSANDKWTNEVQCPPTGGPQRMHIIITITFPLCNSEMIFPTDDISSEKGRCGLGTTDHWPNDEWLFTPFIHQKAPLLPFIVSWMLSSMDQTFTSLSS